MPVSITVSQCHSFKQFHQPPQLSYSIVLQASTVNAVAHIVHTKIVASRQVQGVSSLWTARKHRSMHYAIRPCENQQGNESLIVPFAFKAMPAHNDGKKW